MKCVLEMLLLASVASASFSASGSDLICKDHATQQKIVQLVKQLRVRNVSGLGDVAPGGAFTDVFQFSDISSANGKLVCSAFVTANFKTMKISYRARVTYKEKANGQGAVSVVVDK